MHTFITTALICIAGIGGAIGKSCGSAAKAVSKNPRVVAPAVHAGTRAYNEQRRQDAKNQELLRIQQRIQQQRNNGYNNSYNNSYSGGGYYGY